MSELVVEEEVNLDSLIILGQDEPALLLRWVYESLGIGHETPLDMDWVTALHRGAVNCTETYVDPEFSYCLQLKRYPVDVEKFMFGDEYLKKGRDDIYAVVLEELTLMNNPHGQRVVNCYTEAVLTGGIGCLPPETEFLSTNGWVPIGAYNGELVAQYHPATGKTSYVAAEYVVRPADGFTRFKTKYGLDMVVSDEHRMLYRTSKGNLAVHTAKTVAEMHANSVKGFNGHFLTTFSVDHAGVGLTDAQVRLQVAVQADGSFPSHLKTRHVVVRVKKSRKKNRLYGLLKDAGVPYSESHYLDGYSQITFKAPLKTKSYSWAWECSASQLQVIAQESFHWDGNQKNTFYTTRKKEADFMSYCYSACGLRAVVEEDRRGLCGLLYLVRVNPNAEVSMQGVPKTAMERVESSDGKKYCFTVPTGYFVARHNGKVFITGNSAKSTTALYTVAYQLYVLSCFDNPHNTFGLDPSSEILFVFLGMAGDTATADYDRFYSMIIESPYFRNVFPYDKRKKLELDFPHRIQVVSGINTIGQNVMGGMVDEVNFGALISKSSRSIDGGEYNQTLTVYNGLARRRKSRFNTGGRAPGILCLVSSKRYPGEFTDVKLEEAKTDKSIYVYDKRVWDVKPPGTFSSECFEVFVGDAGRKACIVEDDFHPEPADYPDRVVKIPMDFLKDFKDDLIGSLRDIAGVSTLARYPYFQNVNAIGATFGKVESILSLEETDMITTQLAFYPSLFKNTDCPRWVHVDLGVTSDAAGIACGYVPGFVTTKGGAEIGPMPKVVFDFVLRVKPPKNGEIQFHKIRSLLQLLREKGLPIQWVSFDSFQSVDSIQMLRQIGFATGKQSMDITNAPYAVAKTALYAGRVEAPEHPKAQLEFTSLEKDTRTGKIDHPKNGCFVGGTMIACADGMARSMETLVADYKVGTTHSGFAWDAAKGTATKVQLRHPRVTKTTCQVVEVTLSNGETFTCTPDHPWLLTSGEYLAAGELQPGDEVRD